MSLRERCSVVSVKGKMSSMVCMRSEFELLAYTAPRVHVACFDILFADPRMTCVCVCVVRECPSLRSRHALSRPQNTFTCDKITTDFQI